VNFCPAPCLQPSLTFAPGATCRLYSNGAQQVFGQMICHNVIIQGGNPSGSMQVFWGGPALPQPNFDVRLIE